MSKLFRNLLESPAGGRLARAPLEMSLYAFGAGIFFYLVDVLFMRWQGLALH